MTHGLPFKSIYAHMDGSHTETLAVAVYDQFIRAKERVYQDIGDGVVVPVEIDTYYTVDGLYVSDEVEIIDVLINNLVNNFEFVQCHRMAVLAKVADGPSHCTWTKGYKEFGIGYKPSYADSSNYLPTCLDDALNFLRYWVRYEKNIDDAVIGFSVEKKEFYVKSESLNETWKVNHWFTTWGKPKYEASCESDCHQWAYESTFCPILELHSIGEHDAS